MKGNQNNLNNDYSDKQLKHQQQFYLSKPSILQKTLLTIFNTNHIPNSVALDQRDVLYTQVSDYMRLASVIEMLKVSYQKNYSQSSLLERGFTHKHKKEEGDE